MKIWSSLSPFQSPGSNVYFIVDTNKNIILAPGAGQKIGLNVASPTARTHLAPGGNAAGEGALKFTVAGAALLTTPEVGVLEPISDDLYYTITTGAARKGVVLNDGFAMNPGNVPYVTTNGRITDSYGLSFDATNIILGVQDFGTDSQPGVVITGYNDQINYEPYIDIKKSHDDNFGVVTETVAGEELGGIYFKGVTSLPGFAQGFHIMAIQADNSGAAMVPTDAYFETYGVAALNAFQLVLCYDGTVGIGTNTPFCAFDVVGDIQASAKFGCNSKHPQAAYVSGGALAGYVSGGFGLDSDAHMQAMYDLVVAIRAALVANGIMS